MATSIQAAKDYNPATCTRNFYIKLGKIQVRPEILRKFLQRVRSSELGVGASSLLAATSEGAAEDDAVSPAGKEWRKLRRVSISRDFLWEEKGSRPLEVNEECLLPDVYRLGNSLQHEDENVSKQERGRTGEVAASTAQKRYRVPAVSGEDARTSKRTYNLNIPSPPVSAGMGDGNTNEIFVMETRDRLTSAEDSGYPQSITSSDGNLAHTPSVTTSPKYPKDPGGMAAPSDVLDDSSGGADFIMGKNTDPNLYSDITSTYTQKDTLLTVGVEGEACLPLAQELPDQQNEVFKDGIIFPELDGVLNQTLQPEEAMFEPRDLVVYRSGETGVGEGPFGGYSVETILHSEGISEWLHKFETSQNQFGEASAVCNIDVNNLCHSILSIDTSETDPPTAGGGLSSAEFQNEESPAVNVASVVTVESDTVSPVKAEVQTAPVKKMRGRPRKSSSTTSEIDKPEGQAPQVKRRPRKDSVTCESQLKKGANRVKKGKSMVKSFGQGKNGRSMFGRNIKPTWKAIADMAATILSDEDKQHTAKIARADRTEVKEILGAKATVLVGETLTGESRELDALWRSSVSDDTLPVLNGTTEHIDDMYVSVLEAQGPIGQDKEVKTVTVELDCNGVGGDRGGVSSKEEGCKEEDVFEVNGSLMSCDGDLEAVDTEVPQTPKKISQKIQEAPQIHKKMEEAPQAPNKIEAPEAVPLTPREAALLTQGEAAPQTPKKIEAPEAAPLTQGEAAPQTPKKIEAPEAAPLTQGEAANSPIKTKATPKTLKKVKATKVRVIRLRKGLGGLSTPISPKGTSANLWKTKEGVACQNGTIPFQEMHINLMRCQPRVSANTVDEGCHKTLPSQHPELLSETQPRFVEEECALIENSVKCGQSAMTEPSEDLFVSHSPVSMDISSDCESCLNADHSQRSSSVSEDKPPLAPSAFAAASTPKSLTLKSGVNASNIKTSAFKKMIIHRVTKVKRKLSTKSQDHVTSGPASKRRKHGPPVARKSSSSKSPCSGKSSSPTTPPSTRKFSPPGSVEDDEDCIDLHAMDDDIFATDVGEEDPLARIFPKMKEDKKPRTPSDQPTSVSSRLLSTPDKAHQPSPGISVHQRLDPVLGTPASGHVGGLMSRHGRLQAARQAAHERSCGREMAPGCFSAPSPVLNPFIATPLPPPAISRTNSSECLATPPHSNAKVCHNYLLKGVCSFSPRCKFTHAGWDVTPLNTLEEVMLSYPLNTIPLDVTQRYASDQHSSSLLQSHFSDFVNMIRHTRARNLKGIATGHQLLSSVGVKFSAPFLCRLLGLFAEHSDHLFVKVILSSLKAIRFQLSSEDYSCIFVTMIEHKMLADLKEMYANLKAGSSKLKFPVFSLLLRRGKDLGNWAFQLLDDVKLCDTEDGKVCGLVNQFLKTVSYQLLVQPTNLQKVVDYLDSKPMLASRGITLDTFNKLCGAFCACKLWEALLSLCHRCLHLIPSTRVTICKPLEATISHLGVSEKVLSVFERMSEEQKANLSNEVWNKVVVACCHKGRSQRASKFYSIATKVAKQLSSQAMFSLIDLFKKQHNLSFAVNVLRDGLHRTPPLIPPLPVITSLVTPLEILANAQDLHLMTTALIQNKINPPCAILQLLVKFCCSEKSQSKLVEVVKLAEDSGLGLDKAFRVRVLKELRQWGQDKEAVAMVMKSLEDCKDRGRVSDVGVANSRKSKSYLNPAPPPPPVASIAEATTPSLPTAVSPATLECPPEVGGTPQPSPAKISPNLEEVLQQGPSQDMHELLKLIEFNGKMGQFRAVAAVLVDIEATATQYTDMLVLSIWEGLTSCSIRKANAFSLFVSHLDQCRSSTVCKQSTQPPPPQTPGSSLLPSDRWLLSQVGVALLKISERNTEWQSGFVILHNLHRYGIHYVTTFQPSSPLRPLLPPPSPCSVALTAINICLHLDRETSSALEVMRGCQWVGSCSESERDQRTEMLAALAQRCLDDKMLEATWECLEAINAEEVARKLVHPVTNLHNKLLQGVVNAKSEDFALTVYRSMKKAHLQCLPSVFGALLQLLCDTEKTALAKELCAAAIADNCYAPLVKKDVFEMMFPPGLIRLELQLLLEDHVAKKVVREMQEGNTRDLTIHMSAGSRDLFEQVLTEDIVPPLLGAKFESKLVTIPSQALGEWCYTFPREDKGAAESAEKIVESSEVKEMGIVGVKETEGSEVDVKRPASSAT